MKHLLLSTLLAFSVCTAFAGGANNDADTSKATPKCTAKHVPIVLKTKDGKRYKVFINKNHVKHLKNARGIEAEEIPDCLLCA